jgi:hypothetical protein
MNTWLCLDCKFVFYNDVKIACPKWGSLKVIYHSGE